MSNILLNISPGVLSAIYFCSLDLYALTLLDIILARLVCQLYYRRIINGKALNVKSADIPGVTSYLLGSYLSLTNLFALAIKFLFLVCVFFIDLKIDSTIVRKRSEEFRTSTFNLNLAEEEDHSSYNDLVIKQWESQRQCRTINGNEVTFYHLSFNLSNNLIINDTNVSVNDAHRYNYLFPVNTSTIVCLSPENVENSFIRPLISVNGCSQLQSKTICTNATMISRGVTLELEPGHKDNQIVTVFDPPLYTTFWSRTYKTDFLTSIFPEYTTFPYSNAELTCSITNIGLPIQGSSSYLKQYWSCLLIANYVSESNDTHTLIERWQYDDDLKALKRSFPGPLFNGDIKVGMVQRSKILSRLQKEANWITFSSIIVADATIYEYVEQRFVRQMKSAAMTVIPLYVLVICICLMVLATIGYFIMGRIIGNDYRPQINSINGLSTIAREEYLPSGKTAQGGGSMLLGLSLRHDSKQIRFGPIHPLDKVLKTSEAFA